MSWTDTKDSQGTFIDVSAVYTGGRCTDEEIQLARRACLRQHEEGKITVEELFDVVEALGLKTGTRWYGSSSTTPGTIEVTGRTLNGLYPEHNGGSKHA